MKRLLYILFALTFVVASCYTEEEDDLTPINAGIGKPEGEEPTPTDTQKTILLYLPWSGNLTSYFRTNIADFEKAIQKGILQNERVLVFFATSTEEASLFELAYADGEVTRVPIQTYVTPVFTTASGISSLLAEVKEAAPADRYSMIIGAHGLGWIPVGANTRSRKTISSHKYHWEYEGVPMTRFFGATTSQYQTDVSELAAGISEADMKMEYIMFDDCYMSSIEVAYDLKNVTDHLIGSPTEIMAFGMPYTDIASYLIGNTDYASICNAFLSFYQAYSTPCGTLGVTVSSELDALAAIMKEINSRYTFDSELTETVQRLDGYTPTIFFDYGDYVAKLCPDVTLLGEFETQLNRTVKYRANTDYYYSAIDGTGKVKINTFSGITVSDPSTHSWASSKEETAWYQATH